MSKKTNKLKSRVRTLEQMLAKDGFEKTEHYKALLEECRRLREQVKRDESLRWFKMRMDKIGPRGIGDQYVIQLALSPQAIRYSLMDAQRPWNASSTIAYLCEDLAHKVRTFLLEELTKDGVFR